VEEDGSVTSMWCLLDLYLLAEKFCIPVLKD
jgi:hypothetical protein